MNMSLKNIATALWGEVISYGAFFFNLLFQEKFMEQSILNLKHCEKVTKFGKKSITCYDIYLVMSKQEGDFFKFLLPFRKSKLYKLSVIKLKKYLE